MKILKAIAICALIAAIGIYAFQSFERYQFESETRERCADYVATKPSDDFETWITFRRCVADANGRRQDQGLAGN